jgi:hypothetical protein
MDNLTIDLPEDLIAELKHRHISDEAVHLFVVEAIKAWLRKEAEKPLHLSDQGNEQLSPFAESAIPYIDQLIDENRSLFDRLARLP